MLHHGLADGCDHVAAQDDVVLDGGVTQVEIAVLETLGLVGLAAAVDLERQLVVAAAAKDGDAAGHDLDLASGQLRVLAGALTDNAGDVDGGFLVDGLDDVHHLLRLHDELRRSVEVAQDDEGKVAADDADILQEARQRDRLSDVRQTKLATGMRSGLHHSFFLLSLLLFIFQELRCSDPDRQGPPPGRRAAPRWTRRSVRRWQGT